MRTLLAVVRRLAVAHKVAVREHADRAPLCVVAEADEPAGVGRTALLFKAVHEKVHVGSAGADVLAHDPLGARAPLVRARLDAGQVDQVD